MYIVDIVNTVPQSPGRVNIVNNQKLSFDIVNIVPHSQIIGREVLILTLYVLLALQGCIS